MEKINKIVARKIYGADPARFSGYSLKLIYVRKITFERSTRRDGHISRHVGGLYYVPLGDLLWVEVGMNNVTLHYLTAEYYVRRSVHPRRSRTDRTADEIEKNNFYNFFL